MPIPRLGELSVFPIFHYPISEFTQHSAGNWFSPFLRVLRHWLEMALQAQRQLKGELEQPAAISRLRETEISRNRAWLRPSLVLPILIPLVSAGNSCLKPRYQYIERDPNS